MKRAIVFVMMFAIGMAGLNTDASRDKKEDVTVYICVSKAAKRYHRQENTLFIKKIFLLQNFAKDSHTLLARPPRHAALYFAI